MLLLSLSTLFEPIEGLREPGVLSVGFRLQDRTSRASDKPGEANKAVHTSDKSRCWVSTRTAANASGTPGSKSDWMHIIHKARNLSASHTKQSTITYKEPACNRKIYRLE